MSGETSIGSLSIVATPIGNLDDITIRGVRTLREADAILAEDTRRTRILCAHHGIPTKLKSFHAHSSERRTKEIVDALVEGAMFALVTDAGTPLVSDPGARLVRMAIERGIRVTAIPGASAIMASLVSSGIPCDTFRFLGFLPRSGTRRAALLAQIARAGDATVFFESPQRLHATLMDLGHHLETARQLAICRELTKRFEEVVRGTITELTARFQEGARGEITIVVAAAPRSSSTQHEGLALDATRDERIAAWLAEGHSPRDTARLLAEHAGTSRREAYARVLEVRRNNPTTKI